MKLSVNVIAILLTICATTTQVRSEEFEESETKQPTTQESSAEDDSIQMVTQADLGLKQELIYYGPPKKYIEFSYAELEKLLGKDPGSLNKDSIIMVPGNKKIVDGDRKDVLDKDGFPTFSTVEAKAGEYLKYLNQWESKINAQGLSLRDAPASETTLNKGISLSLLGGKALQDSLKEQLQLFNSSVVLLKDKPEIQNLHNELITDIVRIGKDKEAYNQIVLYDKVLSQRILNYQISFVNDETTSNQHDHSKSYTRSVGDHSSLGVDLNVSAEAHGFEDTLSNKSEISVDVYLFNVNANIFDAVTDSSYDGQYFDATAYLDVRGDRKYNLSLNNQTFGIAGYRNDDDISVSKSITYTYPLAGFINLDVSITASGTVGVEQSQSFVSTRLSQSIVPYALLELDAEVEVDMWVAAVGVGLNLDLLNLELSLANQMEVIEVDGIPTVSSPTLNFKSTLSANIEATILAGEFYVYARILSTTYQDYLFSWRGINMSPASLFSDTKNTRVYY